MGHFIYQDNTFDLINRTWDYDLSRVTCQISKDSISFTDLQTLFPKKEKISFILQLDENISDVFNQESPIDYTVIDWIEEETCNKIILQYIPQEELIFSNIDYLATMLDIDLEE